jgi:hypothetical protein
MLASKAAEFTLAIRGRRNRSLALMNADFRNGVAAAGSFRRRQFEREIEGLSRKP